MATDVSTDYPLELILPKVELVAEDGENLESAWHVFGISLLLDIIYTMMGDRQDMYAGGNQFIYFNIEQARNRDFRGPDVYVVLNTNRQPLRDYWCVWEEGGKYPNVLFEFLSPSTAHLDRTIKKDVYEQTFRTPNYYCYDPYAKALEGWQLLSGAGQYEPLQPNEHGWLWCTQLKLWVGTWEGEYRGTLATWVRLYDQNGRLLPTAAEAAEQGEAGAKKREAEAKQQAADAKQQAAEAKQQLASEQERSAAIEAELTQLKARLAALEGRKESS